MCDTYEAKCETCDNKLPVHIADFCTARENVKVWCENCLEKRPKRKSVAVYQYFEDEKTKYMAIQVLDLNAYGVRPNA